MKLTLLTAIAVALIMSLPMTGWSGMRAQNFQERAYDPDTEATLTGKVVKVEEIQRKGGRSGGIHAVLDTAEGQLQAHLGPRWYIDNLDLGLKPGDTIEVTGSRLQVENDQVIIVRKIKRGDETVTLRDESGVPFWSGWRKGGGGRGGPGMGGGRR